MLAVRLQTSTKDADHRADWHGRCRGFCTRNNVQELFTIAMPRLTNGARACDSEGNELDRETTLAWHGTLGNERAHVPQLQDEALVHAGQKWDMVPMYHSVFTACMDQSQWAAMLALLRDFQSAADIKLVVSSWSECSSPSLRLSV
eukprot:317959-Amphidinium_carterae.1